MFMIIDIILIDYMARMAQKGGLVAKGGDS